MKHFVYFCSLQDFHFSSLLFNKVFFIVYNILFLLSKPDNKNFSQMLKFGDFVDTKIHMNAVNHLNYVFILFKKKTMCVIH